MRKEYLAMMVHELRSPLNAVVGYANVLKLKLKGKIDDSQLGLFDKIIEGGNQLAETNLVPRLILQGLKRVG